MSMRLKFQSKLFLYYTFVVSAIIALSVLSLYFYISGATETREKENQYQLTLKATEQVDLFFDAIDRVALQVGVNPKCVEYFSRISTMDNPQNYFSTDVFASKEILETLHSIIGPKYWVNRVSLYNLKGDHISLGYLAEAESAAVDFLKSEALKKIHSDLAVEQGSRLILPPHEDFWSADKSNLLISVIWTIRNISTKREYGMVEVQQNYGKLESILDFGQSGKMKAYLVSDRGVIFYPPRPDSETQRLVSEYGNLFPDSEPGNKKAINPNNRKEELVALHTSSTTGWSVITAQPLDYVLSAQRLTGTVLVLIGFSLIVLTLFIIFVLTKHLTKPLRQLSSSVREVKLDNLSLALDNTNNDDEILQLNKAFHEMFSRLQNSMNQLVESHSREIKAGLLALQSQMDPHFLYNVLSAISSLAQEKGDLDIMEMCSKLSRMLRYITTYEQKAVTIRDEVGYARNYLELMKSRFEDKFHYTVNIDESILDMQVPKLILQPVTENCFQHGFTGIKPPWKIDIALYTDGARWFMEVGDNGRGMDEEKLRDLYGRIEKITADPAKSLDDLKLGGLGLLNSYLRLKLRYGGEMLFKIDNNHPSGTRITFGGTVL